MEDTTSKKNTLQKSAAPSIEAKKLELPKGGGAIKGISEAFQPNSFTGTGTFSVAIPLPACRNFSPSLSVNYSSGGGNGVFGIGFNVSIASIMRKTSKKVPLFNDEDVFTLAGADDLVPTQQVSTSEYDITFYQPRVEGLFAKIEKLTNKSNFTTYWRVTNNDGSIAIYGKSKQAQIYDPKNNRRIAEWLLEESRDVYGNKIFYYYRSSTKDTNVQSGGRVIDRIAYGYNQELNYNYFEVLFDYGENDFTSPVDKRYSDEREEILRQDSFTSHTTGFAVRTELLCRAIRIYHRFGKEPKLVNGTYFDYDEKPTITYLRAVKQVGYYERGEKRFTKTTPMLVFSHTSDDTTYNSTVSAVTLKNGNKPSKQLLQILREQDFVFSEQSSEIIQENTNWKIKDSENSLIIKEKENFLDLHNASNKNSFKSVKIENFTGYLNDQRFQSVDLYQEGIEGILYNDGNTILYFRPNGNGEFAKAKLLERFPLFLRKPSYSLLSLEGNGELQLYVNENGFQGYHDFDGKSKWSEFKPLESQVVNLSSEIQEMIDVTGDGRTDIVVFEGESVRVYPSQGKKGYKKAIYSKAPKDLPNKRANSESTLIRFADMFGDGKSHLVKIENGKVECWPNLGYGKFGEKVTFKNAPYFKNGFNVKRLYFADIDGSGTTDLVYANHHSLDIYYNNSGNSFSKPVTLKLPVDYNHISRIEFADILGNGTSCLLISYLNQNLKLQHLYYDFYNGVKPHLLKQIDNNMGNITRLHYAASTKFYLQDRKENHPWVTSLPFPVQVIEKIETIDNIVGSKLINKYRYHHGFYDYIEKEFRGFGFVETWDTEDFAIIDQKEHYVAPIHTKTWYHTGAYKKAEDLVESYRKEFYQGDAKALKIITQVFDENIISIEDKRQAYRAIQGQMLRQEVYGLDKNENPNLYEHPYSVTESSAAVKLLRSSSSNNHKEFKYGIFFVNLQETISYHYERNCCDPRIEHNFILEVDEYGNVIKSASITYPRRNQPNNYLEQQKLHVTLEHNFYVNNTERFYLIGTSYKSQAFEIGGFKVQNDKYIDIGSLRTHITDSLKSTIKFEQNLSYTSPQARLLSENHNYYWNEVQSAVLPLGSVTQQALLHHTEAMAFSDSQIKEVFSSKITSDQMLNDCGYKKAANSWWVPSPTQYYYGSDKYYLPEKVIDVFGSETAVVYDQYNLLPIKTIVKATESSSYETTAEYDYQRLTPVKLTDHNDNVSEVILNPLGVVISTSVYGTEKGQEKGDKPLFEYQVRKDSSFADILGLEDGANGPEYYLQNATSFFYYDLKAWRTNGQPVHVINLQRETHVSESTSTRVRQVITHIDGFGRNIETKMLADSESKKWLVSGRVVYNNKGTEVKKYEPFYSYSPFYDLEESVRNQGVSETLYYDPLLRNIRIDTAKGFFSKVEFDSWSTKNFDLNDTVQDSEYYQEFTEKWSRANTEEKAALKDEKDALSKAEKHYNTPTIEHLDSLGRKFLQIEILSKDGQNNIELKSHVKLDIQGNELESVDARFYEQNQGKEETEKIKNFIHVYSMARLLKSTSIDAGETWSLANVVGSSVYSWNNRGFCTHTEHDRLQRPIKVKVTDEELNLNGNVVERFFYSENIADKASNRYGTLIAHYDQAGLTKVEENDFKGQTLKSSYYLRKNYKQEANWQNIESIVTAHSDLEREVFNSSIKYNALGEVTEKTDVQNNTHIPIYDIAGRVKQIKLKKQGENIKTYVSDISYNSKGQRISISYGNGVITNYSYDAKTFRLTKLESTKGQKKLQSINYTYDPVGNITRMKDDSYQEIFPNSKNIDTTSNYHYDSLYRLIQATGKEHPALNGKRGISDKDDYIIPIPHLNNQNAISNYTEYYDFDYGSNITKIRHVGENSSTKEFYISNKSNRSLAIVDNGPINENDIDKSYDERGNLLKLHDSQNLHWNYRDNIAYINIITRPSGKNDSEYYVYDSGGQRIRKVNETYQNDESNYTKVEKIYFGDIEVTRTYQDNNLKKEKYSIHIADDKSRVALHHYWTKGTPEETGNSQSRYQLSNHLDSIALELNDNAEIITYEEYLPFGGTALIAGKTAREVIEKEYRYSGKERDDSMGLYYYGARYYVPWLARWINPDPAGTVDGPNLYQFVGGNPVNSVDVGGMDSEHVTYSTMALGITATLSGMKRMYLLATRREEANIFSIPQTILDLVAGITLIASSFLGESDKEHSDNLTTASNILGSLSLASNFIEGIKTLLCNNIAHNQQEAATQTIIQLQNQQEAATQTIIQLQNQQNVADLENGQVVDQEVNPDPLPPPNLQQTIDMLQAELLNATLEEKQNILNLVQKSIIDMQQEPANLNHSNIHQENENNDNIEPALSEASLEEIGLESKAQNAGKNVMRSHGL